MKQNSVKSRQIDRTLKALQDALVELIREKLYQDIEIKEITDRANTARVTFYRHYATKDELLLDFLARLYEEMKETMGAYCYERLLDVNNPPSLPLFELVAQDKTLYLRLLHSAMGLRIQHQTRIYMVEQISHLLDEDPRFVPMSVRLIAQHIASCTLGNICWWLMADDEVAHKTASEMATLTHQMMMQGLEGLLEGALVRV